MRSVVARNEKEISRAELAILRKREAISEFQPAPIKSYQDDVAIAPGELNWGVSQVRLRPSSALNQVNNYHDNGNYEQKIDQTAADVDEGAQKPEHD
jgi:hypothetical protein